jgi:hypothetical protein
MMSLSAYGRRRGCSHEAVRRAIKSGRLDRSVTIDHKGHPKINDPDLADREWAAHTSEAQQADWDARGAAISRAKGGDGVTRSPQTRPRHNGTAGGNGAGAPQGPGFEGGGAGTGSQLNRAKAARETYEARIAELRYRKMKDELVDADEVKRQFASASRRVRDSLLAVPDRIASVLAAEGDPVRVHQMLLGEIEQSLNALADHAGADG